MIPRFPLAALLAAALAVPARALLPEEENTIKIFREASPSVVFVTNVALGRTMTMDEYAIPQGAGSGFLWDKNGHVVTNYHVVQGGDAFLVTFNDQTQLQAKLIGGDPTHDIAVLQVEDPTEKMRPIKVGSSDQLQVGQQTVAIGNPFGLDHSLTKGIISAVGRQVVGIGGVTIRDMIQTDAAINPGNSGGPLLDSGGNLIGMNTMIFSRSGSSAGIGFAVPVSFIKRIVPQLIRYGKVIRPGIGVTILTPGQKYYLIGDQDGVVVDQVTRGGPAAKAGIRGGRHIAGGRYAIGDIIIGVDDLDVKDFDDLYNALDRYKVGDRVKVKVIRGGKTRVFPVELINIQ
ncbi:MAG: trypsin-like peptidase domain-containing protein [Elusimicrobia bacterium]|nr:trypsin-like peptidase domain-containing protein [Elusimicrobiota bacterium]